MKRNPEAEALLRWSRCHPKAAKISFIVECWVYGALMLLMFGLIIALGLKHGLGWFQ